MNRWYPDDRVIYCDGFLKYDGMENGCSVGLEKDGRIVVRKIYLLENVKSQILNNKINNYEKITNNIIEYFGALNAILWAKHFNVNLIYCDSELIVRQINDEWAVNKEHLKFWNLVCRNIKTDNIQFVWISRNKMVEIFGH